VPTVLAAAQPPTRLVAGQHVRYHHSLLAAPEKRLLIRIAGRLPAWLNSDHLTLLGLVSMLGVGLSFWFAGRVPAIGLPLVVACLAMNWFGDSLDGTVARVRNQQRPRYGFYVDHVIDMIGTGFMLGGLAASGFMTPTIALATLTAWLLVNAESFLATHSRGVFRMSFGWFGPTELRILIAVGALALLRVPAVSLFGLGPFHTFDIAGVAASVGLGCSFVAAAARNTSALYREETIKARE
jgi:phosphatidylglycerophosphate synthase